MEISQAELLSTIKKLPPLSAPLQQVLALLNEDQSSWEKICSIILKDPVLTGRILHIANSSFYGLPRQVKDIEIACTMLGSETLKGLAHTLILMSRFRYGHSDSLIDYDLLWKNCLRVACLVKNISRKFKQDYTLAFTAGLFHCLDLIVQDYFFYDTLKKRISENKSNDCIIKDNKLYRMIDTNTWEFTATLLDSWLFPSGIVSVFQEKSTEDAKKIRMIIICSCILLESFDAYNEISKDTKNDLLSIFEQRNLPIIDIDVCLIESLDMFRQIEYWILN